MSHISSPYLNALNNVLVSTNIRRIAENNKVTDKLTHSNNLLLNLMLTTNCIYDLANLSDNEIINARDDWKELVRILNTCDCCDNHKLNRCVPCHFDGDARPVFWFTHTTQEEKMHPDRCKCKCRHLTRRLGDIYFYSKNYNDGCK